MQIPIESLNMLLLNVGLAHHNADWNWQQVCSPFTRIYYVKEGGARIHFEDKCYELTPGNLYIIPAYTLHSYECEGEFEHYYLHVYEGFKNETNVLEMYQFPTEVRAQESDRSLMEQMVAAHPEARLPESDPQTYDNASMFTGYVKRYNTLPLWEKMRLRGAILLLFSRFLEKATPRVWTTDERLTKVLAHVHSHLHEEISVETLAEMACVTKPYLIRVFKHEFGIPPLQYINKKKIERAQLLLITEDWTVKEVAWKLGFDDHSYFIRLFKKLIGTTPMDYRRNLDVER